MKKNTKPRKLYLLAIKLREVSLTFHSEEEFTKWYEKYIKYYSTSKTQKIYSNLKIDRKKFSGMILVTANELLRVEPIERTLEEIDFLTTSTKNMVQLRTKFRINNYNGYEMVIAYKNNKTYKTLPILFENKKDYIDINKLKSMIKDLAFEDSTFLSIVNTCSSFNDNLSMRESLEKLLLKSNRYELFKKTESTENVKSARRDLEEEIGHFIMKWCKPKNSKGIQEFNYRRFRDLVNFVIDFENKKLEKEYNEINTKCEEIGKEIKFEKTEELSYK